MDMSGLVSPRYAALSFHKPDALRPSLRRKPHQYRGNPTKVSLLVSHPEYNTWMLRQRFPSDIVALFWRNSTWRVLSKLEFPYFVAVEVGRQGVTHLCITIFSE